MYTLNCGCEFDAIVYLSMNCDCCGQSFDIDDAYITKACESHGG